MPVPAIGVILHQVVSMMKFLVTMAMNSCTEYSCDSSVGCVYTKRDCDDNNYCTDDWCTSSGVCQYRAIDCSDGNEYTVDDCNPN